MADEIVGVTGAAIVGASGHEQFIADIARELTGGAVPPSIGRAGVTALRELESRKAVMGRA